MKMSSLPQTSIYDIIVNAMHTTAIIKKNITLLLKKHGVIKASIFGSYARGDMGNKSDIDLVVQFKKRS